MGENGHSFLGFLAIIVVYIHIKIMAEFTDEMKTALFASWSAQVGETIPDIVMNSFMFSHPQAMQPNDETEMIDDGIGNLNPFFSKGHPVVWTKDGTNYKATIEGMVGSTDSVTLSPTGVRIREIRQMVQMYLPQKIQNCILAIHPDWLTSTPSQAYYHTPVVKVVRITDNGGDPNANYWDATYVENWQITFDDPSITMERIKSLPEYQELNTITFDKYGVIV